MDKVFETAYDQLFTKLWTSNPSEEGARFLEQYKDVLKKIIFKTIKPRVNHKEGLKELPKYIEDINAVKAPRGKLKIIFCVPRLYIQHVNHSRGLRECGHKTVLMCSWPLTTYGPPLEEIINEFDYVYCSYYDNFLLFEATGLLQGDLIYTIDYMNNNWFCLILQMLWRGKIVLEIYDLADNAGHPKEFTEKITEKRMGTELADLEDAARHYLYRHADGLIYREEPSAFEKLRQRYAIRCPAVQFHPYFPESTCLQEQTRLSERDGFMHIVHSGFIPPQNSTGGRHIHHSLFKVAKVLADQEIHFHLYNPLDLNGNLLPEFGDLAAHNAFVHYHRPVYIRDLPQILSQYDLGWMVYDFSDRISEQAERYAVAFSSRILTYLAAGLPFLISKEFASMSDFATQKGVGVSLNFRDIYCMIELVRDMDLKALRERVFVVRQELSMGKKACILENLFYSLIEGTKNRDFR